MDNFDHSFGFGQFPLPFAPVMGQYPVFVPQMTPGFDTQIADCEHGPMPPKRVKNNEKERVRTQAINDAFLTLQRRIPYTPSERLPRVKTIRLAVKYIQYLNDLLDQDDPPGCKGVKEEPKPKQDRCRLTAKRRRTNFAQIAASEIQARNNYVERAAVLIESKKCHALPPPPAWQYSPMDNYTTSSFASGHNSQ